MPEITTYKFGFKHPVGGSLVEVKCVHPKDDWLHEEIEEFLQRRKKLLDGGYGSVQDNVMNAILCELALSNLADEVEEFCKKQSVDFDAVKVICVQEGTLEIPDAGYPPKGTVLDWKPGLNFAFMRGDHWYTGERRQG